MWQPVVFLTVAVVLTLARPADAAVDHSPWDTLLKRYVDADGRVAYRDLQAHDRPAFERYLATLAQAQVEGMTEAEEKAFWINAYNAAIVNGVLQGYTAENVFARKRFFSWYTLPVAGKDRSPDEIEHQILRKKFHDPRIHFGVGAATRISSLTINWEKGDQEEFGPFAADATYVVRRGTGRRHD